MTDSGGGPDVTQDLRVPWDEDPGELYEHAPCGYLTMLPDGTIVKVNRTLLDWLGHTRAELIGRRRFRDLLTVGGQLFHETHLAPLLRMSGEITLDQFQQLVDAAKSGGSGAAPGTTAVGGSASPK